MKKVTLIRFFESDEGTFGVLTFDNRPFCVSLELPWRDNQRNISCIPSGTYRCTLETRPSTGEKEYYLNGVPGRAGILIHRGNHVGDIEGCILLGQSYGTSVDKNSVTRYGIAAGTSKVAVDAFRTAMGGNPFELTIADVVPQHAYENFENVCKECRVNTMVKLMAEVIKSVG